MKKEYQRLIDTYKRKYENAKTPNEKKQASIDLESCKSVINALLFNENEMRRLSWFYYRRY